MSGGGGADPSSYQLPGFQEQGTQTRGAVNTLYSQLQGLGGQYVPVTAAMGANPYAAASQTGAGNASQMGMTAANSAAGAAQDIYGQINSAQPYGGQILQNAFDPQNALYARTLQQLQEQQRAGQSARGIAMTPYGQGLEDQALSNFNLDWQNNQLGRQTQGLGAWSNFMQGNAGGAQAAAGLGSGATRLYGESSALPYETYGGIQRGKLDALNAQAQALGLPQTAIADMLGYLQAGNSANSNALRAQEINDQEQGGMMSFIGGGLGLLPWDKWLA